MTYNNIIKTLSKACALAVTGTFLTTSCSKEETWHTPETNPSEKIVPFNVLSVKSYTEGTQSVDLSLNINLSEENLRSTSYTENEETGELNSLQVSETEQMHLFLRKEGDAASTTIATVTWQGRSNNRLSLKKIGVTLPAGYNINPGERWSVMGILGGEFDPATKSIRMGGSKATMSIESINTVDAPYSFAWRPLVIKEKNNAVIPETTMTLHGALLRLNFYNNLPDNYEASGLSIRTNAWQPRGRFYPLSTENQENLGWQSESNNNTATTYSYSLANKMILPSEAERSTSRTIILWGMPTSVTEANTRTEVSLSASVQGSQTKSTLNTYLKAGHRPLQKGFAYRLTNELGDKRRSTETGSNYTMNGSNLATRFAQVPISSATASENHQSGDPIYAIDKSFDGNPSTFYHSKDKSKGPKMPITLTYNLSQPSTLSHIVYTPRDYNGSINAYAISVTYADGTSENIAMPDLGSPTSATEITWPGIDKKPIQQVSFIVKSTGYGVLAVSEMSFFKLADNYYDSSRIFTDLAHTKLRPGITYDEIMAIPDPYYREMARKMHQGTYVREFRIDDYRAWTHPSHQQRINKNQYPYSLHDNPTGIYFKEGEDAIIFVDDTKGHNISLKVMDPQITGFGGHTYKLVPGINKIRMNKSGLGYILYHVDEIDVNRSAHPSIRVHIPEGTGIVNGYFDAQDSRYSGRWAELLSKAKTEHFDVLGQHSHLIFNTSHFRRNTPDGIALINNYDKLVKGEMALMGLLRRGQTTHQPFRNRMLFLRIYDSFMYATAHRTAYNAGNANSSVSESLTKTSVQKYWTWGAAHEVGHMNQTIGLNWGGMIEITNNIHSFYVEHYVFEDSSRSLRDSRYGGGYHSGASNFYNPAWNALFETSSTLSTESKSNNSLIPMLQLQMYFGSILGQTPTEANGYDGFFPRLYQNLRDANYTNSKTAEDNGFQQVELTYHASRAAGYDLTDFFERWGYYRTANNASFRNTYNKEFFITVNQSVVDDAKRRIKALGLRKPTVAFEYITPQNKELFRNPQSIVRGSTVSKTVTDASTTLRLTSWQNVVAWEIRDASGRLLHTDTGGYGKPGAPVTITYTGTWDDSYILNAIDAKGQKVRAN